MNRRKIAKPPKLNLIPILDAIFIFIFFLLMSAQFIDIYEIGSDAPVTSTSDKHPDKDPLNLILELKDNNIIVKTGMDEKINKTIPYSELAKLNEVLVNLKNQYPKESSAILKPNKNYAYYKIVKIIDQTREVTKPNVYVTAVDAQNKKHPSKKLFDQIIFETQE